MPFISLQPPYDYLESIRYWRRSTAELTEQWADGIYRRLVPLDGKSALLSLRPSGTPRGAGRQCRA